MPDWKRMVRERLAPLRLEPGAESALVEEIVQHLEDRYREMRSGGADENEASRAVLAELADLDPLRARTPYRRLPKSEVVPSGDSRSGNWTAGLFRDFRYALRTLRRSPLFALFVVVTLALGIGANTTVFTVINTLLLNPLPVENTGELSAVLATDVAAGHGPEDTFALSYADLKDYRARNGAFQSLAGFTATPRVLTSLEQGTSQQIFGELVTSNYFSTLGLKPARGRFFLPEEDSVSGPNTVAVMSYATWQLRFGAAPSVIGRELRINNIPLTVIGVAPPSFIGLHAIFGPDLWIPAALAERLQPTEMQDELSNRAKASFIGVGRLKPGMTRPQAQTNLAAIASGLAREFPAADEGHSVTVRPVSDILFSSAATSTSQIVFAGVALLVVVGVVLLIACSNVANLLLARSVARRKEIAVRLAVGASRSRLIRQLLTESVLLGLLSGILGILVAFGGLRLLFGTLPGAANFVTPKLDSTVFLFSLALSLATGFLFGAIPAFKTSRTSVSETLKEEGRTAGRSRGRISLANALLVGQVALSFLLLITAALFLRSIGRAYEMDPGFQTSHLAVFGTNPGGAGYSIAQSKAFYKEGRERVARLPGVESVSWASNLPLWARPVSGIEVPGRQQRSRTDNLRAIVTTVDTDYFKTAGVRIESGRAFTGLDNDTAMPVAIVNEKLARDYLPSGALGKRIQLPGEKQFRQIVGVARLANYTTWGEPPQLCIYIPLAQNDSGAMTMFVRSKRDPHEILVPVERELRAAGPQVLVSGTRTGDQIVDGGLFQAKVGVGLLSVFGLLALALASIGLYGILAYSVNQRKREIGLRIALGASSGSVLGLVLKQGMSLVFTGVVIGFAAALLADRVLSRMLYGVSAQDPLSVAGAAVILSAVALLACYLPAHRAARVDPLTALRES